MEIDDLVLRSTSGAVEIDAVECSSKDFLLFIINLDEALEAKFNSLLDDMVLLVAQKGKHAMRISLEDGLEYALKKCRKSRFVRNHIGNEPQKLSLTAIESMTLSDGGVPQHHDSKDDAYGGFGGAHCMIKGGYNFIAESLSEELCIHLNHIVTDISYCKEDVPTKNDLFKKFPKVFWDDSIDYFGATAEEIDERGRCFMFWNVKKIIGAPVLIALVFGKAAINGQEMSSSDNVKHSLLVLHKLYGENKVPDPVASGVTNWGKDPYSYGAYSYVAVGSSGEDCDILGRPVENCLFFAGEATCKEHPDTVGGDMMSRLWEAVRIIDILTTNTDYTAKA
ncbi:hypothetical protein FXO37_19071 [Capsicum annuum]|nr:hypothetical protein FXO37_19071 [Capsicum annuum]